MALWNPAIDLDILSPGETEWTCSAICTGNGAAGRRCTIPLRESALAQLQAMLIRISKLPKDQLRGSRDIRQLADLALCEGRQYTPVDGNRHFIGGHRAKRDRIDDLLQRWDALLVPAQNVPLVNRSYGDTAYAGPERSYDRQSPYRSEDSGFKVEKYSPPARIV